jgi:hypothetical protein
MDGEGETVANDSWEEPVKGWSSLYYDEGHKSAGRDFS